MHEPALSDLVRLVAHIEACAPAMDEVQLVLGVVVVEEPLEAGRVHDPVDAERGNPERDPHLAEAVALAELVEAREGVPAQSFLTICSASSRVNPRSVSVCSAP